MVLRPVVDFPVVQWCDYFWESPHHGLTLAYDGSRYIYYLRGNNTNHFRRYDTIYDTHQFLASAPWNAQQGAHLIYDPSRNFLFAIQGNGGTGFARYNIGVDGWTSLAALPVASSWGSWIVHTCSSLKSGANDDYIYYAPANGSSAFYRYSISGNSFTQLASAPATLGGGSMGVWVYNYDPNKIYVIRGGGTNTIYVYSISGNSWSTLTYYPASFNFSTGSYAVYDPDKNRIYINLNEGFRQIYYLDLNTNKLEVAGRVPLTLQREARRMALVKSGNMTWLYVARGHEGAPFALWRIPIHY